MAAVGPLTPFGDTEAETSRRNDLATDWSRLLCVFERLDAEHRNRLISLCAAWADERMSTEKRVLLAELGRQLLS